MKQAEKTFTKSAVVVECSRRSDERQIDNKPIEHQSLQKSKKKEKSEGFSLGKKLRRFLSLNSSKRQRDNSNENLRAENRQSNPVKNNKSKA